MTQPHGIDDAFGFYDNPRRLNRLIRDLVIVIWTLVVFVKLLHCFYCSLKAEQNTFRPLQYASLTAVGFVLIGYIMSIIELFTLSQVRYLFYGSLNIATGASYMFMLSQLYYSFRSSMYRMSNCTFYLHGILCFLSELFFVTWAILDFIDVHPWKLYAVAISGFFFFVGISHLAYCFNRNLFLVMLHQRKTISISTNYSFDIELTQQQLKVLQMIVKHTILSGFQIGCYISCIVIVTSLAILNPHNSLLFASVFRMWCLVMTIIVVSTCIYLSFVINKNLYWTLCGKCDNCCHAMCQKFAENKIAESSRNLYDYQQL